MAQQTHVAMATLLDGAGLGQEIHRIQENMWYSV